MNKKLIVGAGVVAATAVAVCAGKGCNGEGKQTKWDRMRQRMEDMPADFPPRVMFDNVEATRANTDEIVAMLRHGSRIDDREEVLTSG